MIKKAIINGLLALLISAPTMAQKVIEKTISVNQNTPIKIQLDFPDLKLSTWDKPDIYIKSTVTINKNKDNDRFLLLTEDKEGQCIIRDSIVPERTGNSNNMDLKMEIFIPKNSNLTIINTFGKVEIPKYQGALKVNNQFGLTDVTLTESNVGKLDLTNSFGKIYSDFKVQPIVKESKQFHKVLTAKPGNGPDCSITSKFGNIYLRKEK